MGTVVCNIAKGRFVEFYNRVRLNSPAGAAFVVEPVVGSTADANLIDVDNVDTAQTSFGVFFARRSDTTKLEVELVAADLVPLPAPNDASDRYDISLPKVVASMLGLNLLTNTTRVGVYYAPAGMATARSGWLPIAYADFVLTTAMSGIDDIVIDFNANFLQES